jgi:xanthine dehydrogenase accessory factor
MSDWLPVAIEQLARGEACALITVVRTQGSTPREAGAQMLLYGETQRGTIGGGKLEHDATERARALLASNHREVGTTQTYNLGATLGQCCGGKIELLIERLSSAALPLLMRRSELSARGERFIGVSALGPQSALRRAIVTLSASTGDAIDRRAVAEAQRILSGTERLQAPRWLDLEDSSARILLDAELDQGLPIVLFGAGHVGRALVQVLAPLGWSITWVETRDDAFPRDVPQGVQRVATAVPEACIDEARPRSAFLIMTHDHGLDFTLSERVLRRTDYSFCGLIGSRTKREKFVHRLAARGVPLSAIERLVCPIGIPARSGKAPYEVAIAVAAQLLQVRAASKEGAR